MEKIRVSTDSTADIPPSRAEELGIEVLPLTILAEGKEYRDGVDMTPQEFYQILERSAEIPGTAQVPVQRYTKLFEDTLAAGYSQLIHVTINAKGSGTHQAGVMARELFFEEHPEAEGKLDIHIMDSGTYSMGYGLAVMEGAKLAREGASAEAVMAHIQDWLDHSRVLFIPMNLRFVKKSGRVSAAAAFVGDALGLKPIITFQDGDSKILGKVRGEGKAIAAMVDMALKERRPGTGYALAFGSNPGAFEALKEAAQVLDVPPELTYPLGAVITINAGCDAVGICYRS